MTRSLSLAVLLLFSTIASAQQPGGDLTIQLPSFELIGESNIARGFALVRNRTGADVRDFVVSIGMNGPSTTYIGGDGCVNTDTPYELRCAMPLIRAGQILRLQLYIGPVHETRVFLRASVSWNGPVSPEVRRTVSFPRDFVVTNTGDEGAGTLRDAIERMNLDCVSGIPCRIAFHIAQPVPASGWYTIFPNTPLPEILAPDFEIDGATQTQFGGDTNPLGPEITLDGSALGIGHGLILAGRGFASVSNLAIGGFPWDGIAVLREGFSGSTIANNYIGTDASGTRALPNRSRGITFNRPAYDFDVTHNRISNNARAGVFIAGAFNVLLSENTIHTNSAGVFLGPDSHEVTVEGNYIVDNAQFGVAVAPQATSYRLVDNSITRNGFIGIDRGLDGFSGYENDDSDIYNAKIPPPRVVSATFDPSANATTIVGTYGDANDHWGSWTITLFRSSLNDGQGEVVLGHTAAVNGTFTFTVPGDLSGQFITATGQRALFLGLSGDWYWTSEFSEAVEVR